MAQTGRRMEKIKISPDGVEIHYSVAKKHDVRDELSLISEERPIPQFAMALQAFDTYVQKLCEWPGEKGSDTGILVTIVHISYNEKEARSIIVTAKKDLTGSKGPFCFNTPLVQEGKESKCFTSDIGEKLDNLIKQANAYLDGERLQGELFDKKKKGDKGKKDDAYTEQPPLALIDGTGKN